MENEANTFIESKLNKLEEEIKKSERIKEAQAVKLLRVQEELKEAKCLMPDKLNEMYEDKLTSLSTKSKPLNNDQLIERKIKLEYHLEKIKNQQKIAMKKFVQESAQKYNKIKELEDQLNESNLYFNLDIFSN